MERVSAPPQRHVLLVDDDRATVTGLTKLLATDGYRVFPLTSGGDAVAAISANAFDVIITDLEMPDADGHAIVCAARKHSPNACLVVHTGQASQKRDELVDGGACFVVDKPLDYETLSDALRACPRRASQDSAECPLQAELVRLGLRSG